MLLALLVAAAVPIPTLRSISFTGSNELYASIEIVGAILGLLTGFALCLRFYSLGNRFHLFLGLAFFIGGIKDLVHGLISFRDFFRFIVRVVHSFNPRLLIETGFTEDFIPVAYVSGQLLLCLMLLFALILPGWLRQSTSRKRETTRISLFVFLVTMAISLAIDYSSSRASQAAVLQPALLASISASFVAAFAYLSRYFREHDMLSWWIAGAIGINGIGQCMFLMSTRLYDAMFVASHFYKMLSYVFPLIGFLLYQIAVVLEYQRTQRQLIQAREAALAATRARSEFLANISHEIRTPMNAILGMANRILKTPLDQQQKHYLNTLKSSADSLLTLLNDLLDFSKIESGKFNLHVARFSLNSCVQDAFRSITLTAQEKGITTKIDIDTNVPDEVVGDSIRLRQVLVNLLSNAAKFTEQGEIALRVRCKSADEQQAELHFTVRDTGIGIPTELQSDIFEAFRQADGSTTRLYGGTGLGLAICSQLVELMSGRIWVESEPGFGSRFHFTAKLGLVEPNDEREETNESHHRKDNGQLVTAFSKRIMVVEDNAINREVLVAALKEMGHQPFVANNGEQAIEALAHTPVDAVLMDLQMPVLGGLDATMELRRRAYGARLPIFALTAHAMDSDRQRCLDAGMNGFITKPIDERELFELLEHQVVPPSTRNTEPTSAPTNLVDQDKLLKQVQNDRELLAEIIALFEQQWPELHKALRSAAAVQDAEGVARAAHTLAGSVANFHAPKVREAALQVERFATQTKDGRLLQALDELELLVSQMQNELHSLEWVRS